MYIFKHSHSFVVFLLPRSVIQYFKKVEGHLFVNLLFINVIFLDILKEQLLHKFPLRRTKQNKPLYLQIPTNFFKSSIILGLGIFSLDTSAYYSSTI